MLKAGAYSETTRKLVHMAFGGAALLLRYLTWWQAAILAAAAMLFNIYGLNWLTGGRVHRPGETAMAYPPGLVLYPASILLLLLLFPSRPDIVAASWGILSVGDGAATLVGRRYGTRTWPWNRRKSLTGSAALVVSGGLAGSFLAWWCTPALAIPPPAWFWLAGPFLAAVIAAAAETVPIRLDDNVTVSLTAAAVLWAVSLVRIDLVLLMMSSLGSALPSALFVNGAAAIAGYAAGSVSRSGAAAGACIGTVVHVSTGWNGWLLLVAAFAGAAGTSRMGIERKTLLGIAEEDGGRRGAGNAIANTGVAAVAAALSLVTGEATVWLVAFVAALTAGASDTVASEIGKAWGRRTWAIYPPRSVAPGTSGAVSLEGTAAGIVAALTLASLAVAGGLVPREALIAVVAGAAAGSLVESLLAATLEAPGILNNDALNLINTAVAAAVAVALSGTLT